MIQQSSKHVPARLADFSRFALGFHRWTGTLFGLLFSWYFVAGMVMMYWSFPSVGPEERLTRSLPLRASQARLAPTEAWICAGSPSPLIDIRLRPSTDVQLTSSKPQEGESRSFADNGDVLHAFSSELNARTAAAWVDQPVSSARATALEISWSVDCECPFRELQPLMRYSFPNGEDVYVQDKTGEVVQHTTRTKRLAAYAGAISHWIDLMPSRRIACFGGDSLSGLPQRGIGKRCWDQSGISSSIFSSRRVPYSRLHAILGLNVRFLAYTWLGKRTARSSANSETSRTRSPFRADCGNPVVDRTRHRLSGPAAWPAAPDIAGQTCPCGSKPVLHRLAARRARRDMEQEFLGSALALSRAAFSRRSLAVQAPARPGHPGLVFTARMHRAEVLLAAQFHALQAELTLRLVTEVTILLASAVFLQAESSVATNIVNR